MPGCVHRITRTGHIDKDWIATLAFVPDDDPTPAPVYISVAPQGLTIGSYRVTKLALFHLAWAANVNAAIAERNVGGDFRQSGFEVTHKARMIETVEATGSITITCCTRRYISPGRNPRGQSEAGRATHAARAHSAQCLIRQRSRPSTSFQCPELRSRPRVRTLRIG